MDRLLILLGFIAIINGLPSRLHYEIGDESSFDLSSSLDARGHLLNGKRTGGSFATLDSTLVTQCIKEDDTSYYFVMNMFSTNVNAGEGPSSYEIKNVFEKDWDDDGADDDGADDEDDPNALGEDMYFQQTFDGQITNVWYEEDDSMFFVNIKLGAINALQTHFLPEGSVQSFLVQDPLGNHTAKFQGMSQSNILIIQQDFTQLDVLAFPDPNLSAGNVNIQARTITGITPYPQVSDNGGYIESSTVSQLVDLANIEPGGKKNIKDNNNNDTTALDVKLSSLGSVSITMNQLRQKPKSPKFDYHKIEELKTKGYVRDTIFGIAKKGIFVKPIIQHMNIQIELEEILSDIKSNPSQQVKRMNKLIRYLNQVNQIDFIKNYMNNISSMNAISRKKLLYILAGVNGEESLNIFIQQGINSFDSISKIDSIVASIGMSPKRLNERIMEKLESIAFNDSNKEVQKAAVLSYGSAIGRLIDESKSKYHGRMLLSHLIYTLSNDDNDIDYLVSIVHAIGNAGPAINFESIPWGKLLSHINGNVRIAAVGALRKFDHKDLSLLRLKEKSNNSKIQLIEESNFPFNRSWSKDFSFGGSEVNADFQALLFAGTNFDCNQEYFDYEAQAQADANLAFFGWSKEAFLADAIYGKANGQIIGNQIYLRVWDDVIYNQQLPTLDCSEHIYPLYHTQQGISVSYTLWVSVIPVTFTASASAVVDLEWGWQICDDKLSVEVELIPEVTIILDGDAEVYLLVAKAGIELSGSFNAEVRPQGYIDGANCTVGFDARYESNPAEIDLDSYYQFESCKYWIFDCNWGDRHTQTWFSWSSSSDNKVIFNEDWKIAKVTAN